MKRLYFIRHGESEFNRAKLWNDPTDTPLTPKGLKQARQAGLKAKREGLAFDIVMSSPLTRAHETAKLVAEGVGIPPDQIVIHDKLAERDFGELEGNKELSVLTVKYALDEAAIDAYKGVESLADLQRRADEVLAYLHSLPYDTILVVSHGATGRAIRRSIRNEPLSKRGKPIPNAELLRLI